MRMGRRWVGRGWGVIGSGLRERREVRAARQGRCAVNRCIDAHVCGMRQSPASRCAGLVRTALSCAFPSGQGRPSAWAFADGGFAGRHVCRLRGSRWVDTSNWLATVEEGLLPRVLSIPSPAANRLPNATKLLENYRPDPVPRPDLGE